MLTQTVKFQKSMITEFKFLGEVLLKQQRSWVQFPRKARTDKNVKCVPWMQRNSLWIKAPGKCINVMYANNNLANHKYLGLTYSII